MTSTISIVVPTSPAPAARPVRAAAPTAGGAAEEFGAVLARTADRPAPGNGKPWPAGGGNEELVDAPERDETTDRGAVPPGFEPCVCVVQPTPEPDPSRAAAGNAVENIDDQRSHEDEADQIITEAAAPPASTRTSAVPVATTPDELVTAPLKGADALTMGQRTAPVHAPANPADDRPFSELGTMTQPSGSTGVTRTEQSPAPEPRPAEQSMPLVANSSVVRRGETSQTPVLVRGSMSAQSLPRAEARAAAQVLVAEALSSATVTSPATASDPGRVATLPIASAAPAKPTEPAASIGTPRPSPVVADVVQGEARAVVVSAPGKNLGGGQGTTQEQTRDRGQSPGRAVGLAHAVGLPASMVFPGHASFGAAMERAAPLAQALPPGFAGAALETVIPQVVRSMHMQVTAGGGDMKMTLTPEHLGTVTIELRVDQQRVSASMAADTPAVRVWIAAHQQDLESGLADLGFHLDEFVVRDDDPRERRDHGDAQERPKQPRREKNEESAFEVDA